METKLKSSPRDVLMHLFTIILLYIGTGSFLTLIFQYINLSFPDVLNPSYANNSLRWAIAILIVVYPVFLWASSFIKKDIKVNPEKSELRIRKWLLYFTLFAAAGFIIGDLITLIFNFLNGEITARFILKVLAILIVAVTIFWYYLNELRSHGKKSKQSDKMYAWIISAVIAISIIGGFFVAGSPFSQRLVRIDDQKVGDLQSLQIQILDYWIRKDQLPESLDVLSDPLINPYIPLDPQTGENYGYKKINDLTFELCATFNKSSNKIITGMQRVAYPGVVEDDNWAHGAGENCFERTIDPSLFKQNNPYPKI